MKGFLNFLCIFIPSRKLRHRIRGLRSSGTQWKNNRIAVRKRDGRIVFVKKLKGLKADFNGDNNYIEIAEPIKKLSADIVVSNNVSIIIGPNFYGYFRVMKEFGGNAKNNIRIGKNVCFNGHCRLELAHGGGDVSIGDGCLFSWNIEIRTGDWHAIFDRNTKEVVNHNKSVVIGNHVWIGSDVKILKGVHLANNTIVGTGSIVTKSFEEECTAIAGNPAKIIKRNINWCNCSIEAYRRG